MFLGFTSFFFFCSLFAAKVVKKLVQMGNVPEADIADTEACLLDLRLLNLSHFAELLYSPRLIKRKLTRKVQTPFCCDLKSLRLTSDFLVCTHTHRAQGR